VQSNIHGAIGKRATPILQAHALPPLSRAQAGSPAKDIPFTQARKHAIRHGWHPVKLHSGEHCAYM